MNNLTLIKKIIYRYTKSCDDCKFKVKVKGRDFGFVCNNKNKIVFKKIKKSCNKCGRDPGSKLNGCGKCTGKGWNIYHCAHNFCDCGGWKRAWSLI